MRQAKIERSTTETKILVELALDGSGRYDIRTGCGFFDHMLELFARHGRFDLTVQCDGDKQVDDHHTVEDVGIVLGRCFAQALGDCAGIERYGEKTIPMDEALVQVVIDISGRGLLAFGLRLPTEKIGSFDSQLVREFFEAFARAMGATIHLRQLAGVNSHHIAEAAFKGLARCLAAAVAIDAAHADEIPSTKGTIL